MAVVYNQNQKQDKDQEQTQGQQMTGGVNSPQGAPIGQAPAPQRQGSGRFSNIQKYLGANQNAGQQLAGTVGSRFTKQNTPLIQKQQDQTTQLNQGIQQGRQGVQQGQGFVQTLQNVGQDIKAQTGADKYQPNQQVASIGQFTQSPDFNRFQQIQRGQGVDEGLLNIRQQAAQSANQDFINQNQQNMNMLGSEQGRSDILRKNFSANPMYTQGQNRLDSLFLTRGGLNPLRQQLGGELQTGRNVNQNLQGTLTDINTLRSQEQGLMGNIDTTSKANEQSYLDMLSSYVPKINELRGQEYTGLSDRYGNMATKNLQAGNMIDKSAPMDKDGNPILQKATPGSPGARLSADDLKKLNLTQNMATFDVFDKTKLDDVAMRGRDAAGYQDVAAQGNVDQYNALAKIAGIDPSAQRLTQASTLEDAVQARQGSSALEARLGAARDTFYNETAKTKQGRANTANTLNQHIQSDNNKQWSTMYGNRANEGGGVTLDDVLSGKDIESAARSYGSDVQSRQANNMYKEALKQLQGSGALNVLTTGGDVVSGNDRVRANIDRTQQTNEQLRDSRGLISKYGSTIDEDMKAFLDQYGVKADAVGREKGGEKVIQQRRPSAMTGKLAR